MHAQDVEPLTPEEEAELQKEVEVAIDPYKNTAPPALLQQMREKVAEGLRTHPVSRALLRRFAPRPAVGASGEQTRGGAQDDEQAGGGKEGA
jgi:hypothetical protein